MQRVQLALGFAAIFGAGVATRVATGVYKAVDLGLEGSLLAGILGGYVSGLIAGVLISLPAMLFNGEYLSMPLFAGVGVLGGLAAGSCARSRRRFGEFSPFFDLSVVSDAAQRPAAADTSVPSRVPVDDPVRRMPALDRCCICSVRRDISRCIRSRRVAPVGAVRRIHYHALRSHAAAEDLEQHPQRGESSNRSSVC